MCVSIFSTAFCETLLIQRTNVRQIIINLQWSSRQVPVIIAAFQWNFTFIDWFSKNTKIPNLMKILSVEAELFRVGRRTDGHNTANFDVFLTVHLSIILVINQLNAQFLVLL